MEGEGAHGCWERVSEGCFEGARIMVSYAAETSLLARARQISEVRNSQVELEGLWSDDTGMSMSVKVERAL